ncbi:hypothetical protein BSZ16_17085 [Bradyrhizobium canariense]|nr:hypothetical protein BSZ16_17085 [Bradyrhizobium canariense]
MFQPGPRQALSGFSATRHLLILTILDNVQGKAFVYKCDQGAWRATAIPLPENASVGLPAASNETDEVMFTVSNYPTPTSLCTLTPQETSTFFENSVNRHAITIGSAPPRGQS